MKKELYRVEGKVVGHHHPEINTIIDTWDSLLISLEEWKATIFDIGIVDYAPKNGVIAWIIDTSKSEGVFTPEVQKFREEVARQTLADNGVRHLFVVHSESALGKLAARRTSGLYKGTQMKAHNVASIDEALAILREAGEID